MQDDSPLPSHQPGRKPPYWTMLIDEAAGIDYLEVVIGTRSLEARLPMVVAIHGLGYRPRMPETPLLELDHPVRVIMPRAPIRSGKGFTWLPVRVSDNQPDKLAEALRTTADSLAQMLTALQQRHPTVGKPIVLGFSQGGMLTWTLALYHPELLASAMPMAAWLPPSLVPQRIVDPHALPRLQMMHGLRDPVIPIDPTRALVRQLQALGVGIEWEEFQRAAHSMTPPMKVRLRQWLNTAIAKELAAG